MLYRWEACNGWGYRRPGRPPSSYLWSFSDHYTRGKFAYGGVYDPHLKSQQCGAAVMLKALLAAGTLRGCSGEIIAPRHGAGENEGTLPHWQAI